MALISAPTTYVALQKHFPEVVQSGSVKLFEFDTRFSALASKDFVYYDFNSPLKFVTGDQEVGVSGLREQFDLVMADPPYLDENCLTKTSISIKYLSKEGAKIVLCTGAIMVSNYTVGCNQVGSLTSVGIIRKEFGCIVKGWEFVIRTLHVLKF